MTGGDDVLAVLAGRLTVRDRWLLAMLYEHAVLTTTQLHRLGWATTLRQVQSRTRTLRGHQVLDGFRPLRTYGHGSYPTHLLLGPVGAQVLAAETGMTLTDLGYRGRTRALTVAHRLTLHHDVGVTDLVCDLATTPAVTLAQWWSARRCRRYFGHHHAHPDAYLTLTTRPGTAGGVSAGSRGSPGSQPPGWFEMFLEYDTGSENLSQLASKVAGYHALAEHTGVVTPLAVWITRPGREASARRALAQALQALPTPGRVPILTGGPGPARPVPVAEPDRVTITTGTGTGTGTAGERVWLPLRPGAVDRVTLASLAVARPHPPANPDTGPGVAAGTDPGGPLPAPNPAPPRPADAVEAFYDGLR